MTCETCTHFRRYNEFGGYCHRTSPQIVTVTSPDGWGGTNHSIETHWPFVINADECGKHKEKQA